MSAAKNNINASILILLILGVLFLNGCAVIKITGQIIELAAATVNTSGKVIAATGKIIVTVIKIPYGKNVIKLDKEGDSLFVNTVLNKKIKAKLLLDTGCTSTQLSPQIIEKLGLKNKEGNTVLCTVADGRTVKGKELNIKKVRVGRVKVYNVKAIVLYEGESHNYDGLLGMSFLNNFIFRIDAEKGELVLQKKKK